MHICVQPFICECMCKGKWSNTINLFLHIQSFIIETWFLYLFVCFAWNTFHSFRHFSAYVCACDFITTTSLIRLIAVTDTDPLINGVNIISVHIFLILYFLFSLFWYIWSIIHHKTSLAKIWWFVQISLIWLSISLWPRRLHTINTTHGQPHLTNNISIYYFIIIFVFFLVFIYKILNLC